MKYFSSNKFHQATFSEIFPRLTLDYLKSFIQFAT